MASVILFGTGQLAQTVTVYLERDSAHEVAGYVIDAAYRNGQTTCMGRPVYDWETLETHFKPTDGLLFGPISYRDLNRFRRARYLEGKARGYEFLSFVHPAAHVYTEEIGENCLILEQNVIQPFARIGNNVVIWSNNHIGHHSVIGDHCFITSQVGIAGGCHVGEGCFFGGQSGVIDNRTVAAGSIIGAGATVLTDIGAGDFVQQSPVRTLRGAAGRFARRLLG
ncbi:acetyltransferase [uncultured Tateyamaria sp.]|uniref:acetyltransferase n=1 Tax=Tateyamaria sp. 1078 TaxID=3417464 RepID=UPI002637CD79|nr:acetyltransferase [uncultured Tateyamaria sp.]